MDSLPESEEGLIDVLTARLRESSAGMMLVDERDDPFVVEAALDAASMRAQTPIRWIRVSRSEEYLIVWLREDDERLRDPRSRIVGIRLGQEPEQVA